MLVAPVLHSWFMLRSKFIADRAAGSDEAADVEMLLRKAAVQMALFTSTAEVAKVHVKGTKAKAEPKAKAKAEGKAKAKANPSGKAKGKKSAPGMRRSGVGVHVVQLCTHAAGRLYKGACVQA